MNVKQVRVANLKWLIDHFAGGNQRQFSDELRLNTAHVSQMVNGFRDMGDKIARKIELGLKLAPGAMDAPIENSDHRLTAQARGLAADWLLIAEPLKSQMYEAIHAAAEVARQFGPLAANERVAEYIKHPSKSGEDDDITREN